jgi:hypothetical protein
MQRKVLLLVRGTTFEALNFINVAVLNNFFETKNIFQEKVVFL